MDARPGYAWFTACTCAGGRSIEGLRTTVTISNPEAVQSRRAAGNAFQSMDAKGCF